MRTSTIFEIALMTAVIFVSGCQKQNEPVNQDKETLPGECTIQGNDVNSWPEMVVALTAFAENADSYVWFNDNGQISGATDAVYYVTESGNYYAAGLNKEGQGSISNAKHVTIREGFERHSLTGTYIAAGTPQGWVGSVPNAPQWTSLVQYDEGDDEAGVPPFYEITNWAGTEWSIFLNIDENNKLTIDSETIVCSMQSEFVAGHIIACYMNDERKLVPVHPYEVKYDSKGILDFSSEVDGHPVAVLVLATDMRTGNTVGGFTDGYTNLKLTRDNASEIMSFSGEKITVSTEQLISLFKDNK